MSGLVTKVGAMMSAKGKEDDDLGVAVDNEKEPTSRCDVNQNAAGSSGVATATTTPLRRRLNNSSADAELFWTAPEVLTGKSPVTKASDVYSWAILVAEILTQAPPYWELTGALTATQVLEGVVWTELRPQLPRDTPPPVRHLLDRAWLQEAELRPPTSALLSMAHSAFPAPVTSVERALDVIDVCLGCETEVKPYVPEATRYSSHGAGASGAEELPETTSSSSPSSLPRPRPPTPQLPLPGVSVGTAYECEGVAVVSVAVVGVGALVTRSSPSNVVDAVSSLYAMAATHLGGPGMLLYETWADCFMAVAGAYPPSSRDRDPLGPATLHDSPSSLSPPATAAIAALNFLSAAKRFISQNRFLGLTVHSGMALGCTLVGVLRLGQPRVVVVGDAVSTATGLANAAPDMTVHVTSGVHRVLTSEPDVQFIFAKSPRIADIPEADTAESVKGERRVTTWLLLGRKEEGENSPPPTPASPSPHSV